MSLVGPRPLPEAEDARVGGSRARPARPHARASPASGRCSAGPSIPFEEMVKLDYLYVTNWSLWIDLRLLMKTLPRCFSVAGRTRGRLERAGRPAQRGGAVRRRRG